MRQYLDYMMKTGIYLKNWPVLRVFFLSWRLAGITLLALSATGCGSTKRVGITAATDSLSWNEKVSVTLATIPMSIAQASIPIDSLRNLPTGAIFEQKSGQASMRLAYEKGTVIATASCDSLQELVYAYERQLDSLRLRHQSTQTEIQTTAHPFHGFFYGFLSGIALIALFLLFFKYKQ